MGKELSVQQKEDINAKASLEKRYEHLKAKQRDRGGIFKPREDNPFLELLMARDISGRSPTKRRSMSRQSSVDRQSRDAGSKKKDQAQSSNADGRKSVVGSVAGRQRRKSVAPDLANEQPDDGKPTRSKPRASSASRTVSKQSDGTTKPKGKSLAPKRPREDEELADDEDVPSPPKRLKKSTARMSSASTSTSKIKKATRKAPTKAAVKSRSKSQDAYLPSSVDVDESERPEPHPKVQNKKGKSGKVSAETNDDIPPRKAVGKPARTSNNRPNSSKKQKIPMSTKNGEDVDDDNDIRPPAGNNTKWKAKGKRQSKPSAPAGLEEAGSTQQRTKLPKPHLETVFEEDEDEALNASVTRLSKTSAASKSRKDEGVQPAKESESKKGKRTDKTIMTDDSNAKPSAKQIKSNAKSSSRSKASASKVVETDVEERKPASKARRKGNDSASTSRSKSSATKAKAKPKATSKRANSIPLKPTFKNLATTMLTSPIKPANNEADELDFL